MEEVTFGYNKQIAPDRHPRFGLAPEEMEKDNPDLTIRDAHASTRDAAIRNTEDDAVNESLGVPAAPLPGGQLRRSLNPEYGGAPRRTRVTAPGPIRTLSGHTGLAPSPQFAVYFIAAGRPFGNARSECVLATVNAAIFTSGNG